MKPAFPQPCNERGAPAFVDGGMLLRDYFAAAVLQGLASRATSPWPDNISHDVEMAYKYADAMMKQRENQP